MSSPPTSASGSPGLHPGRPLAPERRALVASWIPRWVPRALLLGALVALVAIPLLVLLRTALETGLAPLLESLASAWPSMVASAWTSLAATGLAVTVGTAFAVLTERTDVPGRRGLRLALLVAFILPGYVAAMGWLAAYGPGGVLDDLVGLSVPALVGPLGIVLVLATEALPVAYLVAAAGLAGRAEPDTERAARISGAGALETFRSVTLPLLAPVIGAAAAITFVLSLTAFGVPAVLGTPAGFQTMTTRIYRDLAFSSDPASFTRGVGLAIVLAVSAVLVIALADRLLERRRRDRSGAFAGPLGAAGTAAPGPLDDGARRGALHSFGAPRPRALAAAASAWLLVLLAVVLPMLALLLTALTRAPGLDPVPSNWTLDNFAEVIDGRTVQALGNSLALAAAAAAGVIGLAALAVLARRGRGAGSAGSLLALTFALPGSTLAVAVLLAYGVALRDTLAIILVAYLAKFWALGMRPVAAGLDAIPLDAMRAARSSGAGPWTATRTVLLPWLRPMLVAGALIVFMFGLHEVTMSSLLYGPGSATLAVVVLNLQQYGDMGPTAALALLLTLVVALAGLPLARRSGVLERVRWRG